MSLTEAENLQDCASSHADAIAAMRERLTVIGNHRVFAGDCLDIMGALKYGRQVDSIVTDPPYHLASIVKRFGGDNAAPAIGNAAYKRASSGFMGQKWDGGDIAFRPETWRRCFDLLKPGGHLIAFCGDRTYHRMACAIEDAGFEIRRTGGWLYGSGFPKSHDISKAIDRHGGAAVSWFGKWLREWRAENNIKQSQISALFPSKTGGKTGCVANWELGLNLPTVEQFNKICLEFNLPFESLEEAKRKIIGKSDGSLLAVAPGQNNDRSAATLDITAPATPEARQWEGWGTDLKPAFEPFVIARKPLSEPTIAANVLRHGTGGLNIDGCRVGSEAAGWGGRPSNGYSGGLTAGGSPRPVQGRFPANLILTYPENEYKLKDNITTDEMRMLADWIDGKKT